MATATTAQAGEEEPMHLRLSKHLQTVERTNTHGRVAEWIPLQALALPSKAQNLGQTLHVQVREGGRTERGGGWGRVGTRCTYFPLQRVSARADGPATDVQCAAKNHSYSPAARARRCTYFLSARFGSAAFFPSLPPFESSQRMYALTSVGRCIFRVPRR